MQATTRPSSTSPENLPHNNSPLFIILNAINRNTVLHQLWSSLWGVNVLIQKETRVKVRVTVEDVYGKVGNYYICNVIVLLDEMETATTAYLINPTKGQVFEGILEEVS